MRLLTTTALLAVAATTACAQPQWLDCARIDMGGYYIYADPRCPQLEGDGGTTFTIDHGTVVVGPGIDDGPGDDGPGDDGPGDDGPGDDGPGDDGPGNDDDDHPQTGTEGQNGRDRDGPPPRSGCNGRGCEAGSGGGNSEGNEQSEQDGD